MSTCKVRVKKNILNELISDNGDEDMAYQSEAALEAQFVKQLNNGSAVETPITSFSLTLPEILK